MDRICSVCNVSKNVSEFNVKNKLRGTLDTFCRSCRRAYWKNYYAQPDKRKKQIQNSRKNTLLRVDRLREILLPLKQSPCVDCKNTYPPICMDFDHIENKEWNISSLVGSALSEEALKKELSKCELVCSNCHRIRTAKRGRWDIRLIGE